MRHHPNFCQLCDLFEYVGNWGPPAGDPPPHDAYPYIDGHRGAHLPGPANERQPRSGDHSGG